jgi:hypothetical protein
MDVMDAKAASDVQREAPSVKSARRVLEVLEY